MIDLEVAVMSLWWEGCTLWSAERQAFLAVLGVSVHLFHGEFFYGCLVGCGTHHGSADRE